MIIGNIKNCERYYALHKDMKKAFDWLKSLKPELMDKTEIDGSNVWGKVFEDVNKEKTNYEAHREFIDIHYMLDNSEDFGWADIENLKTEIEYDESKDCGFFGGELNSIILNQGDFCIVFPEDGHIPGYGVDGKALRAMVKIHI